MRYCAIFCASARHCSPRPRSTTPGATRYPHWWIRQVARAISALLRRHPRRGQLHPPLTLRVNRRRISRDDYLQSLAQQELAATAVGADGVTLARAVPVERLPGFVEGLVSVQDAAAQLAAPLLDAQPRMRVLDACAAPGGKTTHLLELADLALTAVDHDAGRLARVQQNLSRLGLAATLKTADVNDVAAWWDGQPFERILADVPCSAVRRRAPPSRHQMVAARERSAAFRQTATAHARHSVAIAGQWW